MWLGQVGSLHTRAKFFRTHHLIPRVSTHSKYTQVIIWVLECIVLVVIFEDSFSGVIPVAAEKINKMAKGGLLNEVVFC